MLVPAGPRGPPAPPRGLPSGGEPRRRRGMGLWGVAVPEGRRPRPGVTLSSAAPQIHSPDGPCNLFPTSAPHSDHWEVLFA